MENIIVTTIDSVGSVEVQNDLAVFTIGVKFKNDSLSAAESQAKNKIDQILKSLDSLKEGGMKVEGEFVTSFTNYKLEHREGNEKIHAGFQCAGAVSWTIVVDERIDEFYKACLAIDPNMTRPTFSIKDRERFTNEALQMAADNVKEKLEKECSLLGVSVSELKIQNWNFGYEGHLAALNSSPNFNNHRSYGVGGITGPTGPQGATGSVGMAAYMPQVTMRLGSIYLEPLDTKIVPGSETFRIAVRVNYVRNTK